MSINSFEKPEVEIIDRVNSNGINEEPAEDWSDIDEKKVLRKIDIHLIPLISVLYLLCYLDRGNIGNAKIEGLTEELNLSTNEYNLCLTIFFITYSFFEVPSNMLLKRIGKQSLYLPSIMLAWGIVMVTMGVVQGFSGLFVTRLLLGVFEAGLFPGISYGLTMYYVKSEMQFRQAMFYSAASIAGAFSGLLAFAIAKMNGVGGYSGWRWIFILEGLLTVVVAIIAYFLLPDYPDTAKFLNQRERDFILWRLQNDNIIDDDQLLDNEKIKRVKPSFKNFNDKNDIPLKRALFLVFKDWQIVFQVFLYWGIACPTYGVSLFLPTVIKRLGYTSSQAQLLTIPIYVTASLCSVLQAYFADKVGIRSIFVGSDMILVLIGFSMAIAGEETGVPGVIYAGVFIAVIGLYSSFPGMIAWVANNLANSRKRAIGMALHIGLGNLSGAFTSNFYKPNNFTMGHGLELGFATVGFISCLILVAGYKTINVKRQKELVNGKYDEVSDEEIFKMGDKSPYFRYKI